jgi:hypothetical protein
MKVLLGHQGMRAEALSGCLAISKEGAARHQGMRAEASSGRQAISKEGARVAPEAFVLTRAAVV